MNDVANIEQTNSSDPVERRHQLGVAQLGLGVLNRRLIGFDRGFELRDLGLLRGYLLLWGKALLLQRNIPTEVELRIFEMGLVADEIRLRLVELRLISARIELGQQVALS